MTRTPVVGPRSPVYMGSVCQIITSSFGSSTRPVSGVMVHTYKPNASLGIVRPPNAFSYFLRSLKGTATTYQHVRLRRKTTIWRMDLLKQKFWAMGSSRREPYRDAAMQALVDARDKRAAALRDGAPIARPAAVAAPPNSDDGYPGIARTAAVAAGTFHVWMQVELPQGTPVLAVAASPTTSSPACTVLGVQWTSQGGLDHKFKVCSKVGSGGYGACMVVKNEVTAETMVAKIAMGKSSSCRVCVKTALRKEFAALCKLNHPNVVRAYAIVNVVPGPGIAMLLPHLACDLWQWVVNRASAADAPAVAGTVDLTIPVDEKSVLLQVTSGVAYIHGRNIVHCDLKPDNVLVDFVARSHDRGGGGSEEDDRGGGGSCVHCQIADFGMCQATVEMDGVPSSGRVLAEFVNTQAYRPFWLFRKPDVVPVKPMYDVWALAAIIFDVAQAPDVRMRGHAGDFTRFMGRASLDTLDSNDGAYRGIWLERNRRVVQHARPAVRPLILEAQPQFPLMSSPSALCTYTKLAKVRCV